MTNPTQKFLSDLKSRNEDIRNKAARDLHHFINTELRERSTEDISEFLDNFNHQIINMLSSNDSNEKKGGICGMCSLIGVDIGHFSTTSSRYANNLRNLLPNNDVSVMEMAAKAIGKLALHAASLTDEYVDKEAQRAFEWLQGERVELRRHAAVLVLRQLAIHVPTFFFQHIPAFFDSIFHAIRDQKPVIREGAAAALKSALVVTSQRESKERGRFPWYEKCFNEAKKPYDELASRKLSRDDWAHGTLLIINELLRISNVEGERVRFEMEEITKEQLQHERSYKELHSSKSGKHQNNASQLQLSGIAFSGPRPTKAALVESKTCKELTNEAFRDLCTIVLRNRSSKNPLIMQALSIVLPRLSAFNPHEFMIYHFDESINYLYSSIREKRERAAAFHSIALIAVSIQKDITPHLATIMEHIKKCLPTRDITSKKTKNVIVEPAVFFCISMLARAVGHHIAVEVKDLLEPMFESGLSPALTAALKDLAQQIPSLKKDIQSGLLQMLSKVLMGKSLKPLGSGRQSRPSLPPVSSYSSLDSFQNVGNVTLALKTLGSFDFENQTLKQFVRHCADNYLSSERKEIRMEAVRTCTRLLLPSVALASSHQPSDSAMNTVAEVLSKLLVVGITDSDADIRYSVLLWLDERFDPHLAQAENLSALLLTVNDEVFEIRELAIATIGRLSSKNPAYVMPSLRRLLINILTELEHSGMGRNKEQAAKLLGVLISSAPRLIRPYMEPILNVLKPKLKENDPNPAVTIAIMNAIGEQAQVCGTEMRAYGAELLPLIFDMLQDSASHQKREVAVWTLGQLVESTGFVVEPYELSPALLDVLLSFLKTEQTPAMRRETLRVLGLLGALDPYKYKVHTGVINQSAGAALSEAKPGENRLGQTEMNSNTETLIAMNTAASLDEFYLVVSLSALLRILRDPTLVQYQKGAARSINLIFKHLALKCIPYLPLLLPDYMSVCRSTAELNFKESLFKDLADMVTAVGEHMRKYSANLFALVKEFWPQCSITVISLLEALVSALGPDFKVYLPEIIPHMLKTLAHDSSRDRHVTVALLTALQKFGVNLDDYLHLLLPHLIKLFDNQDVPLPVKTLSLETIATFSESVDLTEYASKLIHPLVRTMDNSADLRTCALKTLICLMRQLGKKFLIFIPMVKKVTQQHRFDETIKAEFELLTSRIMKGTTIGEEDQDPLLRKVEKERKNEDAKGSKPTEMGVGKLHISSASLQKIFQTNRQVSRDDWIEWLRRLSVAFLSNSPSWALRTCSSVALSYPALARHLFNAAFVSCWTELQDTQQDDIVSSLENVLKTQDIPELTQTILNLAEFMDHCDKGPIPINTGLLSDKAVQCRAFAKALHYREEAFHSEPTKNVLESLISINIKLGQSESAAGLLEYAQEMYGPEIQERWYEKLHDWPNALKKYEQKLQYSPTDKELTLGRMRCLEALGEWEDLQKVAKEEWQIAESTFKQKMARMASAAAWALRDWESMEEYSCMIPRDTYDGAFYRSVLALHMDQFQLAQQCIDKARDIVDTELTAMAGESYSRAYGAMVNVQMLSELEEVIQYKLVPERREVIKEMWWKRLQGCQRVVEDWQKIIHVHSLVLSPREHKKTWLKYASLCRKSQRLKLSLKTLVTLLGADPQIQPCASLCIDEPEINLAYYKHAWKSDPSEKPLSDLTSFVRNQLEPKLAELESMRSEKTESLCILLAKCYMKMGEWNEALYGVEEDSIPNILDCYSEAKKKYDGWYKSWHAWAFMNYKSVLFFKQKSIKDPKEPEKRRESRIKSFCVPAVNGFFKSISLCSIGRSLQDTLRLLTLWFDYGSHSEVYEALVEGLKTIQMDHWLQVIPQLMARIDTNKPNVGNLIQQLLSDIGRAHPQALVYPLTVAAKSSDEIRKQAATRVLNSIREHRPLLVDQAVLMSDELIRVAILWHELWHEGLEEASRLFFGEKNIGGMLATLAPLHGMLDKGPSTLKETSFEQTYGRDLREAAEWCRKYERSNQLKDLTQAWDQYYHVFRRITKQLPQMTTLELQYVSPKLLAASDMQLVVPGTYDPQQPEVRIKYVQQTLSVITSKQRPRKLSIFGSDGHEYQFLLKGHEDLRQDERVMQLFGLVNSLLARSSDTAKRNLSIQRYSVIPLSTNSGLLGWVPQTDTLHSLIRDYRERKKILLNIEHRIMLRMAQDYDHLPLMKKVEVFEHALEHTQGDDLAKILWYKSPSSEVWFDRRTNYTRSLAVMSMVGYVLGLGDRHPSNLMLDRLNGKIIHIDFGDCFEVAMIRDKFPEKIPFRLTRMLTNAMEVTGINGNYRHTCISVMNVLRSNKDSVMAVLEAFVHDPLLNWRLMEGKAAKHSKKGSGSYTEVGGPAVTSSSDAILEEPGMLELTGPSRKTVNDRLSLLNKSGQSEGLNKKAVAIVTRVKDKLTGFDFPSRKEGVDVATQVDLLTKQATSHENLCQCYIGWCPFW